MRWRRPTSRDLASVAVNGAGLLLIMASHLTIPERRARELDANYERSVAMYAVGLAVILAALLIRPSRRARGAGNTSDRWSLLTGSGVLLWAIIDAPVDAFWLQLPLLLIALGVMSAAYKDDRFSKFSEAVAKLGGWRAEAPAGLRIQIRRSTDGTAPGKRRFALAVTGLSTSLRVDASSGGISAAELDPALSSVHVKGDEASAVLLLAGDRRIAEWIQSFGALQDGTLQAEIAIPSEPTVSQMRKDIAWLLAVAREVRRASRPTAAKLLRATRLDVPPGIRERCYRLLQERFADSREAQEARAARENASSSQLTLLDPAAGEGALAIADARGAVSVAKTTR